VKTLGSLLHEPLVQFMGLGALLFVLHAAVGGGLGDRERITVTRGQIEHLAATFARTWQRPPTRRELDGLVEDWVRTEIAARQARALGLDDEDAVIRRLLRQKLEFVTEDAGQAVPTDAELRAYLAEHPEAFRAPARFTFKQIYFSSARRTDPAGDARALLARLGAGAALDGDAGDPLLAPGEFVEVSQPDVEGIFGPTFGDELATVPLGRWSGPIASGYGLHLVLVQRRSEEAVPPLEEIRPAVEREWQQARRTRVLDEAYRRMRARYDVVVEPFADGTSAVESSG
jgi:hypothetical protein